MNALALRQPATAASPPDPAVAFLLNRDGGRLAHSGATLIDHLVGVEAKLRAWGCREAVCRAGLFHSAYGTEHYRRQTLSLLERQDVRALIGEEAEALAHAFCELRTREFLDRLPSGEEPGGTDPIEPIDRDLLHLFVANWLEQLPRMRVLHRATHTIAFRRLRGHLVEAARRELDLAYDFADATARPTERVLLAGPRRPLMPLPRVRVIDGLVPAHLRMRLTALTERNIWRFGWRAAATQTSHHFWHSHFGGDNEDADASCEHELEGRALVAPVLDLWHLVRDKIAPGHVPVRAYANGHTFGADGDLHTDCDRPGHFTTIYYAHDVWDANWAGETVFFDEQGVDVLQAVFPKPGRLVHFPGYLPHAARGPSRTCPALRTVIVIKSYDPAFDARDG